MKKPSDIVDELRVGIDMSDQQTTQMIYEKWLKLEQWTAREIALPLIIGCDPEQWSNYVEQHQLTASEELLWHVVSNDLGKEPDDSLSIAAINEWARIQTVSLHPSFLRIYEFVRKVMMSSMPPNLAGDENNAETEASRSTEQRTDIARAMEHEIVLGAALSLLSKMPDKCRDTNGFADGAKIAELIQQTAVKWFPASSPLLNKNEMAELIDKWLE